MKRPQVLILAENDFHRRLMADVVCCNEMRAISSNCLDWVKRVEDGSCRADVVVIDCGMGEQEVANAISRLHALPEAVRPRVIGWAREHEENRSSRSLEVEEKVAFPLDVGDFARVVKRHAHARVLANSL